MSVRAIWVRGKCVKYTNTRYLAASVDKGPVPGETDIVYKSGDGWRDYLVLGKGSL